MRRNHGWMAVAGVLALGGVAVEAGAETKTYVGTKGPSYWQDGWNWEPFGEPGPSDHVVYPERNYGNVAYTELNGNTAPIDSLTLYDHALLFLSDYLLMVDALDDSGLTTIDGGSIEVWPAISGVTFATDNLDILSGGIRMWDHAAIVQVDDTMFVAEAGTVSGKGQIKLVNAMSVGSVLLDVDGAIEAINGTLTIQVLGGGMMDLGAPTTTVRATGAEAVYLDGIQAAPIIGELTMYDDSFITFTDVLAIYGDVNFFGWGYLGASHFTFGAGSTIDVTSDGYSFITGITVLGEGCAVDITGTGLWFNSPTALEGASIATEGTLVFDSNTTFNGGTVSGGGNMTINGPLDVFGDTTVTLPDGVVAFGAFGPIDIDVHTSATLDIDAAQLDDLDGSMTVFGGVLDITTDDPWNLTGSMTLNTGVVDGSEIVVASGGLVETIGFQDEIAAPMTVQANGQVDIGSSTWISGELTLDGGVVVGQGTLYQEGDVHAVAPSLLSVDDLDWDGSTEGAHQTIIDAGSGLIVTGDNIELTMFDGYDGTITMGDGSTLWVATLEEWKMDGRLTIGATAEVIGDDMLVRGRIEGDSGGTDEIDVRTTGVTAPGLPLGTLHIDYGDFEQITYGTLEIELGGNVPWTNYDRLQVTDGTATLAGTLHVRLRDGYQPVEGQPWTILVAQSIVGGFETVIDQVGVTIEQTDTYVRLHYVGGVNPADFDEDGQVATTDFLELLSMWGPCPLSQPCPWDLDADGEVGTTDFLILLSLWG